jgi:hypothetical protein
LIGADQPRSSLIGRRPHTGSAGLSLFDVPEGENHMTMRFSALAAAACAMALTACGQGTKEAEPVTEPAATAAATEAAPGDGDSQGDALVPGTNYNATAQIPCARECGVAPRDRLLGWRLPWGKFAHGVDGNAGASVAASSSSRSSLPLAEMKDA